MIHEISPHRFNNQYWADKNIEEKDFIFQFKGNSLLIKGSEDEFEIPRIEDFPGISDKNSSVFLFTINDVSCHLLLDELSEEPRGLKYREISFFRTIKRREVAWITLVAFHLMNWYSHNKYCGKCGAATVKKTEERALVCPQCNSVVYPKISPAVIVAIVCNDKILLARNTNFPGNWFSLIAGYADIGESLEETLVREVKEEVGLDIKNIRYYSSQPWPLSGSMMIGFVAEADENQIISIDEKEISEAAWFTRGNLPEHPSKISIAGEMIEKFEKGELF
jgi:NAD+ diphosphatase